jgi:D-3-phosphoglycerate dehydrogenase
VIKIRAYTIFDDYDDYSAYLIRSSGIQLDIHPSNVPRPSSDEMKAILEDYDCVIVGTSQKITSCMFEKVATPKIIATASVGIDHICIPDNKRNLVKIINTPKANAQSVAEYTIGCALSCIKRLRESTRLYMHGYDNKHLFKKPRELKNSVFGVIGAGLISETIMRHAQFWGANVICWTPHPQFHQNIAKSGVQFVTLKQIFEESDILSVNLPSTPETKELISKTYIELMKNDAIFISISRIDILDFQELFSKALINPTFYICLDIDIVQCVAEIYENNDNIIITPHIAGGTVETRNRMFLEIANQICVISNKV